MLNSVQGVDPGGETSPSHGLAAKSREFLPAACRAARRARDISCGLALSRLTRGPCPLVDVASILSEAALDGIEQRLGLDWLGEERDSATRACPLHRGSVGIAADHHHRHLLSGARESVLEVEPGHPRHANVDNETDRPRDFLRREKVTSGSKDNDMVASGPQQPAQGPLDRGIVVDDANVHEIACLAAAGSATVTTAPPAC